MPTMDFFPQRPPVSPKIYAYELIGVASHKGYIKVGYTERDVDTRIREQTHTVAVPYRVLERKYSFDDPVQLSLPPVIGLLADIIFLTPVSYA